MSRIDSRSEQVFTLSNGSSFGFVPFWNMKIENTVMAVIVSATSVFMARAVDTLFVEDIA